MPVIRRQKAHPTIGKFFLVNDTSLGQVENPFR
jgi:hypothetical protein